LSQANPFIEFIARYGKDWVLLVREVLGGNPDADQEWLLRAVCAGERRVSIRSGHGVGKTTGLSWLIICHALTRFPQKTVCTAPTSSQLFDALASEVKAWMKKLPPLVLDLFEIQVDQIKLRAAPEESFIAFRTSKPETPEAMAGVHSDHVLLICDEASGIPDPVFEAAAGSMSGESATTVLAGNPVRTTGLFFDTFHKLAEKWDRRHISCIGHPRISADFIDDMKRRYGEDSNAFRVRVLGEFPTGDDDTVIPFEIAEAALKRDVSAHLVKEIWGLDVGRFGNDPSALCRRKGNVLVKPTEIKQGYDTMQVVGWVKSIWDFLLPSQQPSEILVDLIGIGSGVCDRLAELGLPARGVNVSESAAMDGQYVNLRAELWFKGREWLARKDCHISADDALMSELVQPRFKYASNGKRQVESKDDMKKRGVKSPNRADAFLLTLAGQAVTASDGPLTRSSWNKPLERRILGIV
jgi:hypothetical protein